MKKNIYNIGAIVLSISMIAVSVGILPAPASAAVSDWQKGVTIQPHSTTDFASDQFHQTVTKAKGDGFNYVTLVLPYYQGNLYSTDLAPGWNTPTDATLVSAINYIHAQGMHVMLKPHVESYDGQWRAYINPGDRATWFSKYGGILNHLADIGKANGVEEISVGAELISMATYTSNGDNTQQWQKLIAGVRSRYSGALTYSANWGGDGFPDEKSHIGFWGSLDYIGISAYFNLYGGNDLQNLKNQWNQYNNSQIKTLSDANGKPVLFTEIGYRSVSNAHQDPWNSGRGGSYDAQEQVNDYTALFDYWNSQSFMKGIQIWDWSVDPNAGGNGNTDYTPQNKPAEGTIKSWFSGGTTGTGDNGGGTTTPPNNGGGTTVSGNFTASATANPSSPAVNQSVTITPSVSDTGASSNVIVDVEIYNASSAQVLQKAFTGESFSANQTKTYPVTWTPTQTGDYTVKIGVFNQDWTHNYLWNNNAVTFTVSQTGSGGNTGGTGTTTNTGGDTGGSNTSFSMGATVSPAQPSVSQGVNITASASSKGSVSDAIVDYEIYNASNSRVFQQIFIGQNFSATQPKGYQFGWTPTTAGTYTIKGGLFNSNWSTNYYWNDNMTTFSVGASTGNTGGDTGGNTGGNTGGTGTTTDTGGTTNPPQTNYTTNIWWPTNGATVSGVLPFKAMVDGLDVSQYSMAWQVDGGALVDMANSTTDYPHKEALVDVSGWNWKGNGPYTLNFVSKNSSGTVISQQSTNINIQH